MTLALTDSTTDNQQRQAWQALARFQGFSDEIVNAITVENAILTLAIPLHEKSAAASETVAFYALASTVLKDASLQQPMIVNGRLQWRLNATEVENIAENQQKLYDKDAVYGVDGWMNRARILLRNAPVNIQEAMGGHVLLHALRPGTSVPEQLPPTVGLEIATVNQQLGLYRVTAAPELQKVLRQAVLHIGNTLQVNEPMTSKGDTDSWLVNGAQIEALSRVFQAVASSK